MPGHTKERSTTNNSDKFFYVFRERIERRVTFDSNLPPLRFTKLTKYGTVFP
jgi:hypothetical protein